MKKYKMITILFIIVTVAFVMAFTYFKNSTTRKRIVMWKRRFNSNKLPNKKLTLSGGLYEQGGKPFIWLFWEGSKRPSYLELCLKTIQCHNSPDFNVKVLGASELKKSVSFVHPAFDYMRFIHQADYYRGQILHNYGGIYLDMDTIALKSLKDIFRNLVAYDVFGVQYTPAKSLINMGAIGPMRANSTLTRKWTERVHAILDEKIESFKAFREGRGKYPLSRSEILGDVLRPLLRNLVEKREISYRGIDGLKTWLQFGIAQMTTTSNIVEKFKDTELLVLNNAMFPKSFTTLSMDGVLESPFGVSQLLRKSLASCAARTEK